MMPGFLFPRETSLVNNLTTFSTFSVLWMILPLFSVREHPFINSKNNANGVIFSQHFIPHRSFYGFVHCLYCRTNNGKGSAPALPRNFSAHREMRPPVTESWAHREVRLPRRQINSALIKVCHQPLAEASGMDD
jgi:hypothetical protein